MTSDLPRHVYPVADRHGKIRYRFRRRGWPSPYLPGEPGSAEFHRAYAAIIEGGPRVAEPVASTQKVTPRSLDDLVVRHKKSMRWNRNKPRTQLNQSRILARFMDRCDAKGRRYGERPVASVTVAWLENIYRQMNDTPGAANNLRKILCGLMDTACRMSPPWREDNPARLSGKFSDGEGFHEWTDAEIEQYRAHHAIGTMARLTLELALNTAARLCNVSQIERDHVVDGMILVNHVKGNHDTAVPMLATTKVALDALPAAPIRFLITTQYGKPFSVDGLGNKMRQWCDEASLPQCTMHGLRKAMSRHLAEGGATDAEGQAVTGQKKPATFANYRAKANRSALAMKAVSNLGPLASFQPEENDDNSNV